MVGCLAIQEIRHQLDVDCADSAASRTFHSSLLAHGQLTLSRLAETMGVPVEDQRAGGTLKATCRTDGQ